MAELTEENGIALTQFNRLINEILRGRLNRNCFRPWEIDFLLEIDSANLRLLVNDMLGELNSSHQGFTSSGDEEKTVYAWRTMASPASIIVASCRVKITRSAKATLPPLVRPCLPTFSWMESTSMLRFRSAAMAAGRW